MVLHEGGYSTAYAPFCTLAVIEELSGVTSGVDDPFKDFLGNMPAQKLTPCQEEAIGCIVDTHKAVWNI